MLKTIMFISALLSIGAVNAQQERSPARSVERNIPAPALTEVMQQFAAENGSYIVEVPSSKDIVFDGELTLEMAQKVDPKKMGIAILDRGQLFKISGTDKMLIVKSTWVLDNEMKTAKK